MKTFVFDERESTLKNALRSAIGEQDDYVFIRLNPHLSSRMDQLLKINFICFGKTAAPSLKNRPLATTQDMLETLISGNVPSLVQLARLKLPNQLPLPDHVIKKLI
jgi:hypothetical protein